MKNQQHGCRSFSSDRFGDMLHHRGQSVNFPPVKVSEEEDHYTIKLGVPGYEKSDFKITLSGDALTVLVESELKNDFKSIHDLDFGKRPFKRKFLLNEKIDTEKITPSYENGVLSIRLDKKEVFHTPVIEIDIA